MEFTSYVNKHTSLSSLYRMVITRQTNFTDYQTYKFHTAFRLYVKTEVSITYRSDTHWQLDRPYLL